MTDSNKIPPRKRSVGGKPPTWRRPLADPVYDHCEFIGHDPILLGDLTTRCSKCGIVMAKGTPTDRYLELPAAPVLIKAPPKPLPFQPLAKTRWEIAADMFASFFTVLGPLVLLACAVLWLLDRWFK